MQNRRPPIPVIIILILLIAAAIYFGLRSVGNEDNGQLKASGTIESVTVNVSPEMAGKVVEVFAEEGQSVKADDALLRLDDSLLQSEKQAGQAALDSANASVQTAQAALEAAQLQYDSILFNALAQEQASRITVWKDSKPGEFNLPVWYFLKQEQMKAAQAEGEAKQKALEDALKKLDDASNKAGGAQFLDIEMTLAKARLAFQIAQTVYDSTNGASDSQELRDAAQVTLDEAKIDLEDAQKDYDDALNTEGATDVLEARADVVIAQELYDTAVDKLRALQTGKNSPAVLTASKAVEQAQAMLKQVQTNVASAQARLDSIDVQLAKVTGYAPMDGVILTRNVEPGEFVQPGAGAFSMADLNNIVITVYVPEDRYGQITLGQPAKVTVDSLPDEIFNAEVIHIADQAEFTPRNVQTVEGRSSTVYAIKLKVTDSEGKLKIGMPADVVFK